VAEYGMAGAANCTRHTAWHQSIRANTQLNEDIDKLIADLKNGNGAFANGKVGTADATFTILDQDIL